MIHIHRISLRNRSFNHFLGLRTDFRRIRPVRSWAETTSYRVPQIPRIPTDFFDLFGLWIKGTQMTQISQILTCSVWDFADFADNLQISFFFLGDFEEKAYFCG